MIHYALTLNLACDHCLQSNLMYGWKLYSYRTLLDSALTMVSLQLGIFNYDEVSKGKLSKLQLWPWWQVFDWYLLPIQVLDYNPVLGAFLIGSCIIFMTFVVLNLFISVILVAFTQELIHHKVLCINLTRCQININISESTGTNISIHFDWGGHLAIHSELSVHCSTALWGGDSGLEADEALQLAWNQS